MTLEEYAKYELEMAGLFNKDSDYNGMLAKSVMELIKVFSKQGHSGCSANMTLNLFNKLSMFKPISPLTGKDKEWVKVTKDLYQNRRNSEIFKEGKNGKPYFISAYIKRTPNGNTWQGKLKLKDGRSLGKCYIKDFDNIPTIIIDVLENDFEMWIKDEKQLDELAKYYDFEIS